MTHGLSTTLPLMPLNKHFVRRSTVGLFSPDTNQHALRDLREESSVSAETMSPTNGLGLQGVTREKGLSQDV
eukprot:1150279-Pelagomonas_calceolata.AAC.2